MGKNLTVDLTRTNAIQYASEQLFQADGYEKLRELFQDTLTWREHLENSHTAEKAIDHIAKCRLHDAILIFGGRGCGKTTFLANMENQLKSNSSELAKSFAFLDLIDPTLLCGSREIHSSEAFISVIVALINSHVQKEIEKKEDRERKTYYQKLKEVAEALQAMKSRSDEFGIDEIFSNQTTLQLEQSLHEYFRSVTELLGKRILVLRIDDIDMAFTHGFQILETVRKYLASPYILPVISGDKKLYSVLIQKNFSRDMYSLVFPKRPCSEVAEKDFQDHVSNLSEKYTIKVMPFDRQLRLVNLAEILLANEITFRLNTEKTITLKEVQSLEADFFNHGVKRPDYQNKALSRGIDSTRTWIQYHQKMSSWYRKNLTDNADFEQWFVLYREFQQTHYDFFVNSEQHQDLAFWSNINCQASENQAYNHQILLKVLDTENRSPKQGALIALEGAAEVAASKWLSFPLSGIDPHSKTETVLQKIQDFPLKARLLLKLFIVNNYYARVPQTHWFLFSGRFVELLFATISSKYQGKDKNENRYDWNTALTDHLNILDGNPLFTVVEFHKNLVDLPEDKHESVSVAGSIDVNKEELAALFNEIMPPDDPQNNAEEKFIWRITEKDFLDAHFMRTVLDRFYHNLNVFRNEKTYLQETILSYARRCVFMLLNAVGACELNQFDKIAFQNIALLPEITEETLQKNDNAYARNIAPFVNSEKKSLTKILYCHPLVRVILNEDDLADLGRNALRRADSIAQPSEMSLRQKIAQTANMATLIALLQQEPEESVADLLKMPLPRHVWGRKMRTLFKRGLQDEKETLCKITGKDAAYFA